MYGWEKIKDFLPHDRWLTTAEIAQKANLKVDHIRRVLNWNLKHENWLERQGRPAQWKKISDARL